MTIGMNIDTFISKFKTGARSYLFYMEPKFQGNTSLASVDARYLVKSTSLPTSSFEELTASWQGFDYKAAGKRSYDNWTVSFNVDYGAKIRTAYIDWMNLILDPRTNKPSLPSEYMADQVVSLLSVENFEPVLTYNLWRAWPSQVGEVTLDYADSAYATFDVTFTYLYFTSTDNRGQVVS